MKLWLDDARPAPEGWKHVMEVRLALMFLLVEDSLKELSLDHDLGQDQPTGYDLLVCMARLRLTVPKITVHSQNPEAALAMRTFIEQMELERPAHDEQTI